MIVVLCIFVGLALRLITRRSFRDLGLVKLRGEPFLLALLVLQATLPLVPLDGTAARVAYFIWVATFPCMIAAAFLNRQEPGMPVVGVGLLLNLMAIAPNGGMPVFELANQFPGASTEAIAIPASDFVHVLGGPASYLPWLGDVLPLPGPAGLRSAVSPGDLLLFVGVIAFVGMAGSRKAFDATPRE